MTALEALMCRAASAKNIEVLAESIEKAEEIGGTDKTVSMAKDTLAKLQEERRRKVEEDMFKAANAGNIRELVESIEEAEKIGASEEALSMANDNLAKLRQQINRANVESGCDVKAKRTSKSTKNQTKPGKSDDMKDA